MHHELSAGILDMRWHVAEATAQKRFGGRDGVALCATFNGALATEVGKGQSHVILLLIASGRDREATT